MSLLAITDAGVLYKDAVFAGEEVQNITRVIFRHIDGLVPETVIDLTQSLPSTDIVHSQPIERVGALDDNAVVMSTVLGYDVGNFQYNWYGVVAKKADLSEVLIAVVQTPVQTKTKTDGATTGNYNVKSIVWKTANIAESLSVSLSALPWQVADNTFVTKVAYDLGMDDKLDKTANAQNALKLGNQLPAYYATKAALDTLSALIASDDVSLDEIQEIVNYIKLNRSDLDALSIGSIAGLIAALAGKLGTNEKATSALLADNATLLAGRHPHHYRGLNNGGSTGDPNVAVDQVILTNHANGPETPNYFHITTTFYAGITTTGNRGQIAVSYAGTTRMYTRTCYSGIWSTWVRCDNNGTVYDSDRLDGLHAHLGKNNEPNKVVRTDASGYASFGWINTLSGNTTSATDSYFVDTGDGYIRKKTLAQVKAEINTDTNTHRAISSSVSSTSTSVSASSAAVRSAYNKANHSHPYASSTHTHTVTRTTLLNSASGITSGNLSLSGWQNYDMLEVLGVDANDNRATTNFHTPSSLIQGLASASDGKYVLWDNGSGAHWWVKGYSSSSLTYDSDNARILRIVGIKFTS